MSSSTSNRQPPPSAPTAYRQDDERRRDDARLTTLQNQVDELRQAMRELISRQSRGEEQLKQYEAPAAQNRLAIETLRQEAAQTSQARALDENRTRQQVGDLETRLEDVTRPIRSLQAHVMELLEVARKKTDDVGQYRQRDDELQVQIEHLSAQVDRTAVMIHQGRDSLATVREEGDGLRRDLMRVEDSIKIVDQEARRRTSEVAQSSQNVVARIDESRSDLGHLFDLIDDTRRAIVHIDPALEELREGDAVLRQDIARFQAQAIERHELAMERAEDSRIEIDARLDDLRQAQDGRHDRLTERLEELAEAHRDLGFRLSSFSGQIDELRLADVSLRRDLWILNEQRIRLRLEHAQQELDVIVNQRRDAEAGEVSLVRPPRRHLDH